MLRRLISKTSLLLLKSWSSNRQLWVASISNKLEDIDIRVLKGMKDVLLEALANEAILFDSACSRVAPIPPQRYAKAWSRSAWAIESRK
jgi:hypothetical protein